MIFSSTKSENRTSAETQCLHLIVADLLIQNSIEYKLMPLNISSKVHLSNKARPVKLAHISHATQNIPWMAKILNIRSAQDAHLYSASTQNIDALVKEAKMAPTGSSYTHLHFWLVHSEGTLHVADGNDIFFLPLKFLLIQWSLANL